MRIIPNTGSDTAAAAIEAALPPGGSIDLAGNRFSLFAFDELTPAFKRAASLRIVLPASANLHPLGGDGDRPIRRQLRASSIASSFSKTIGQRCQVRYAASPLPQGLLIVRDSNAQPLLAIYGAFDFDRPGLGLAAADPLAMVYLAENPTEATPQADWFNRQWDAHPETPDAANQLTRDLTEHTTARAPRQIYALILHHLLEGRRQQGGLDEADVLNRATGIRDSVVWNMLYKFQRDGVVGVIDKLARHGGCILADSVGLGKTFEALAVIKYHELRNDRVLVLCPKRLRDNWTVHTLNDRRNNLSADRFNYDVLNHTDLSRAHGHSGDLDLAHLNWGNYDLVVIDESHNFRNKKTPKRGFETRYDKLMRRIIQEGNKTRVLMLSATPVNNKLTDLRNQIAFATEGNDEALADEGIPSINQTIRGAQKQFNTWLDLPPGDRTPARLVDRLGFGYFTLLDLLTIARSRRHIEKYYGTAETGRFPERLPPINIKSDIDARKEMPPVSHLNGEIARLNLAAYAPLRYVRPERRASYEKKYDTAMQGGSVFRQADRESSLIQLMRVNLLKRLESSIHAFNLTLHRQLADVEALIDRIDDHDTSPDPISISDIGQLDLDDPDTEALTVGKKVKVLLADVDRLRWRQELVEDQTRLENLATAADRVGPGRDAKLDDLRKMIQHKAQNPINPGNRKLIVFTAFAETAVYLYDQLADWAKTNLKLECGLLTGGNNNKSTLGHVRDNQADILTAFAPKAKQRHEDDDHAGDIDLLIATDCVSEGQNLQDCDWLINYDIHWNPVRIIQRFGRIDRLGSTNATIQLANFWPNMEIEEYLDLENRVSGRMVLLDVSATGEENLIERQSGDPMNDLPYRRAQLLKLQDTVIDLDDLSAGVSIADLTLNDVRVDLADFKREHPGCLEAEPPGTFAVCHATDPADVGHVFCLKDASPAANDPDRIPDPADPLAPYHLVHVGPQGAIVLPPARVRGLLDLVKRNAQSRHGVDPDALAAHHQTTRHGRDMTPVTDALAAATAAVTGATEQKRASDLFAPGASATAVRERPTHGDFEVMAWLELLPPPSESATP